jgi:hypothetical protein
MSKRFRTGMLALGLLVAGLVVAFVRPGSGSNANDSMRRTVSIVYRHGAVEGGLRRVTVRRGARVTLLVRADVRDDVHLHGYDIMRAVEPGRRARISVTARLAGRFVTELEQRKIPIAEVDVEP